MTPAEIKEFAKKIGFNEVRITGSTPKTWGQFAEWIDNQYHGEMHYLANRVYERRDTSNLLESARSVIVVAKQYKTVDPPRPSPEKPFTPLISRYAWGDDYHDIVTDGLKKVVAYIHDRTNGKHKARWYTDTGPILEKDFAAQAGLGWTGKHTNILSRNLGNWFFLGVILTTLKLDPDMPETSHCGTCSRCLDVCPTKAFIQPYILDARRCISYLTIELKGPIPREFRKAIGSRIYGCDDCLEVCPWNRFAVQSNEEGFFPRAEISTIDLIQFMKLTDDEFRKLFKGSPVKRTKRRGFLRNVAIALGNTHNPKAIPVLIEALNDTEPLIRGHAAWALGEMRDHTPIETLKNSLNKEQDDWVREEITHAIKSHSGTYTGTLSA